MLLLYLKPQTVSTATSIFTFHYASTLSYLWRRGHGSKDRFTFHYASTLSRLPFSCSRRISRFTFHYASTLSECTEICPLKKLNLHSTMLLLYQSRPGSKIFLIAIYIPLCFYFIRAVRILQEAECLFTFHYASTLSGFNPLQEISESTFTFHYASTLSRLPDTQLTNEQLNLHSTMLLLYLPGGFRCVRDDQIYIPLCFYFIQERRRMWSW